MADTPFTTFAFKSTTGSATRTMPDRLDSVFNVRDFGASPTASAATNVTAIQACIDAAQATLPGSATRGATVFFPPGAYQINATLTIDGTLGSGLKLLGSGGCTFSDEDTSKIWGDVNGYLLKETYEPVHGLSNQSVLHSIQDLGFANHHTVTPGSITDTEMAPGCIHLPGGIGPRIVGCNMTIQNGGVCLFSNAQNMQVQSCNLAGNWDGTHASDTIGFVGQSFAVRDCKIYGLGYGVIGAGNNFASFGVIENIDFEVLGCAIMLGGCPIGILPNLTPPSAPIIRPASASYCYGAVISAINIENPGATDGSALAAIYLYGGEMQRIFIQSVNCLADGARGGAAPLYGVRLEGAVRNSVFESINMVGNDSGAPGAGQGGFVNNCYSINAVCDGVRFFGCEGNNSHTAAGPVWDLSGMTFAAGDNGVTFDRCRQTDGAVPLASLPPSPSSFGQTMVCSNASSAFNASNVGTNITTGGGAHKVLARWNGTNWTYAG